MRLMCCGGVGSSVLQLNTLSGSNISGSSGVGSYHLLLPTSAAGAATGLTADPSAGTTAAVVLTATNTATGTSGTISAATRASLIHTLTL